MIRVRANWAAGALTTPKSGKVRSVPMAPDVARVLAHLGRRDRFTNEDDLVFVGVAGGHLDGDALSSRYRNALKRADLRTLRFHDLRHTFGTRMIAKADVRRVQEWMGHADIQTTMKYLHYAPRAGDAARWSQRRSRSTRRWLRRRPDPRVGAGRSAVGGTSDFIACWPGGVATAFTRTGYPVRSPDSGQGSGYAADWLVRAL
jgi:hypothetical protein